jgi:hypothetical protein
VVLRLAGRDDRSVAELRPEPGRRIRKVGRAEDELDTRTASAADASIDPIRTRAHGSVTSLT